MAPSFRVPRAQRMGMEIISDRKCTDPSARTVVAPPGCLLFMPLTRLSAREVMVEIVQPGAFGGGSSLGNPNVLIGIIVDTVMGFFEKTPL